MGGRNPKNSRQNSNEPINLNLCECNFDCKKCRLMEEFNNWVNELIYFKCGYRIYIDINTCALLQRGPSFLLQERKYGAQFYMGDGRQLQDVNFSNGNGYIKKFNGNKNIFIFGVRRPSYTSYIDNTLYVHKLFLLSLLLLFIVDLLSEICIYYKRLF